MYGEEVRLGVAVVLLLTAVEWGDLNEYCHECQAHEVGIADRAMLPLFRTAPVNRHACFKSGRS